MNKIFIIAGLILLTASSLYSQSLEVDIEQIRAWFRDVNSNISTYRKAELTDINISQDANSNLFSKEGEKIYRLGVVNLTKYYDDEQLVKLTVEFDGDREDLTSDYYFKDGHLFFVDKIKTIYHRPKWHDDFNETQKSIGKNRFYIKNNRVIRWSTLEKDNVGIHDPAFVENESMIINDYMLYISIK